jgi:hypothetical protein
MGAAASAPSQKRDEGNNTLLAVAPTPSKQQVVRFQNEARATSLDKAQRPVDASECHADSVTESSGDGIMRMFRSLFRTRGRVVQECPSQEREKQEHLPQARQQPGSMHIFSMSQPGARSRQEKEVPKQHPALRTKDDQRDSKDSSSKQNTDSLRMRTMQNSNKSRQNSSLYHPQSTHQVPCKRALRHSKKTY